MIVAFIIIILLLFSIRKKQLSISKENSNGIKGILALLIVLHHCSILYNNGNSDLIWFHSIGNWICGMFFFISAYGLHSQEDKIKNTSFLNFTRNRIWNILSPFLIITLGYQILLAITGDYNLVELINTLKKGNTEMLLPYSWFVFSLIYLYILTFLSTLFTKSYIKISFMFFMISVYTLIIKYIFHWDSWWYTSIYGYFLGLVCQKNYLTIHRLNIWRIYAIIALFLTYIYSKINNILTIVTPPYLSLIFVYGICNLPINKICHKLSFLNKISYEIYLFQGYALTLFFKDFEGNIIIYLLGVYGVTLALASAYYYIYKKPYHTKIIKSLLK